MVDDCTEPVRTRQMCNRHYQQWLKNTPLTARSPSKPAPSRRCSVRGCTDLVRGKGLCSAHYQRSRRGAPLASPLRRNGRTDVRDEQGRKRCSKCNDWLPVSEFYRLASGATRDGLSTNCNLCDRLYRYRITAHDYRQMLAAQGGTCAICDRVPAEFCIDHDHGCCPERKRSCGKCIRGLLCPDCNGALGLMADAPERLRRAASYLEGGDAT